MFNKTETRTLGIQEGRELYVTLTGFYNYYDKKPFAIGNLIRCRKEPDNRYDCEAIRCTLPMLGTVGYVANSVSTVAGGTMSAGRIYDKVDEKFYVRVMFTTCSKVICRVERGSQDLLRRELEEQQRKNEWDD
ncbi:MAG: HIRAN domain-containing protein [Oscillospiraceae bacterium]|nr:HIRAN domain-containing protein [Oscillospiraceae bacterium]